MKRVVVAYVVAALMLVSAVGTVVYARMQSARAAEVQEAARSKASDVWLYCQAQRRDELYTLWSWASAQYRHGVPPGSRLEPAFTARSNLVRMNSLCGKDDEYARQIEFVAFLVTTNQWPQAIKRLYELRNEPEDTWPKLEVVMPAEAVADAVLLGDVYFAGARPMPNFELSAWSRWHPTGRDDAHAIAFTLIGGAVTSWQIAIGSRRDLFPIGKVDAPVAAAIVEQLASIGLRVLPPEAGVSLLEWAWSAPYAEFERIAREAESADPATDKVEPVASLLQQPYDYRRFRDLFDRVRPSRMNAPNP